MTVEGECGAIDQAYTGSRKLDKSTQNKLKRRLSMVKKVDERAYRTVVTIHLPAKSRKVDLDAIQKAGKASTSVVVETDFKSKTAKFTMGADTEIFVPKDVSKMDANGELHPKELSAAKNKQPKQQKFGVPPRYKKNPKAPINITTKKATFNKKWIQFQKNRF